MRRRFATCSHLVKWTASTAHIASSCVRLLLSMATTLSQLSPVPSKFHFTPFFSPLPLPCSLLSPPLHPSLPTYPLPLWPSLMQQLESARSQASISEARQKELEEVRQSLPVTLVPAVTDACLRSLAWSQIDQHIDCSMWRLYGAMITLSFRLCAFHRPPLSPSTPTCVSG